MIVALVWCMLRITTHENQRVLTLLLEGRLEGSLAAELEDCWRKTLASPGRSTLRVDLTGVTFVDAAGKARLAAMHKQGAELIASDCLIKAVVEEITSARSSSSEANVP
jgi:anti-anti-sigma regulatory factor